MDLASRVVVSLPLALVTQRMLKRLHWQCVLLQVIKIGTSSLLRPDLSSINLSSLARICEIVKELRTLGKSSAAAAFFGVPNDTT